MLSRTAPGAVAAGANHWTPAYLAEQQAYDSDIGPALAWIEGGHRPNWNEVKSRSPALRSLWQQYESLVMRDGVLNRIFHNFDGSVSHYQVVLPSSLKVAFLELIHADAAGHLRSYVKCAEHVQRRAWWSTWKQDLKLYLHCCGPCSAYFRGTPPKQAKLHPVLLGAPGEKWNIDMVGNFSPSNGYRYIFTDIVHSVNMLSLCQLVQRRLT